MLWGASYVMTRELFLTEPHITVPIIITMRLVAVAVVFLPLLLATNRLQPIAKKDLKWFLLLAAIEPFVHNMLETGGVKYVGSSLSAILVATCPVFVPFAMAALYKDPIRRNHLLGVVLSVVGIGVMLIGGEGSLEGSVKGVAMLMGAVAMSIAYTILTARIVDRYDPMSVTMYQNLFGLGYYLPVMLLTSGQQLAMLSWSAEMIGLLVALGILCSMLAYACYNYGVQKAGPTRASVFVNGIPVVTMLLAIGIGQECFSGWKVLGMAVVIFGIFLAQRTKKVRNEVQGIKKTE